MWVLACTKYGIQGAFGALDDVFGGAFGAREGASEVDRGARAQYAPPHSGCAPAWLHWWQRRLGQVYPSAFQ